MNYYSALQRKADARYDYTLQNNGVAFPVGYCAGWREWDDQTISLAFSSREHYETWRREHERLIPKYHTDGHATYEGACACYRQYLLDTSIRFGTDTNTQRKCVECQTWSTGFATIGSLIFPLCEVHQTRDDVEKHMSPVGTITSSY